MLAGGWALLMPVAHMHCLHVSSVAGSLPWQSCGHATGSLRIKTCRNHCILMLLIKTLIIYIYVAGVDPLKFGYIQSFEAIAVFWSHRCFAAMVKSSWPTGVTSWADTVKFVQLLSPHNSN